MCIRDRERTKVCEISDLYLKASECSNSFPFMYRFHVYYLANCEGREKEAYEKHMDLYEEGRKHLIEKGVMTWKPTLIVQIGELEQKLGIPESDRIPERFDKQSFRIITPIRP